VLSKAGLTTPIDRFLVRHVGVSLVTWATRVNRGLEYIPTLLLTTVGRRSGQLRDVALGYYVHDGRVVVIASSGGSAEHPSWYLNLQENPLVWVTINRRRHACDARTASGHERDAVWSYVKGRVPEYATYETRAGAHGRELPVVICTPRAPVPGLRAW
jgi:deazaflavin-dependent oxidoreductase (nitroreductase family)